jgi:serine/threonine protein kinase/Flp pilus assembly protein TadD
MPADAQKVQSIFHEAVEHHAAAAWPAFLDLACGGDAELRAAVEALLRGHEQANSLLDEPAPTSATAAELTASAPGAVIGPYKLIQLIGEGGMGTVWMAQQQEPVKRLVALKLIKAGMDSKQVLARFEAERQALALMDHPNIAKVLDAGTTGEPSRVSDRVTTGDTRRLTPLGSPGRPYFVMELVKGVPITKYCDEHHLTPRQRLELFIPVCQAVQHAHQKGIIHRDLKPTNVLVALYDGKPVPKVIDFGVAKAAGQPLTEQTLVTGFGAIVGTLEYMSPEQAEVNQLDIDTRSDIYSLGVLLYELLTGSPPFTRKELEKAGMLEMLRVIREQEPSKPSTKLSTAEGLPTLAANRGTEPAKLTKLMRGELDWLVMKALEKDRNRRYETANGFAMDVQRYLADEPVQACPPSAAYRLRKFVRRNKGPVLAASLVAVALVGGVIGTTWGMLRATFAEAEAFREAGEKTVALGEKTVALGEKETALAAAEANEIQAKAAQKDAQENLKDALAALEQMLTRVAEDKLAYVPQMETIRRDLLLDALKFYQKFLEKQSDDPVIRREAALAYRRVGRIHFHFSQHKDAEKAYRNAFLMFDKLDPSALADPALLHEMVSCHIEFSWPLYHLGKGEEMLQSIRRAAELADRLDKNAPGNRGCILNARNNLASILVSQDPHEAEKILKENLALAGDDTFNLEGVHRGLAHVFVATGRSPEAEEAFRQALKYAEQMAKENPSADWVQAAVANDQRLLARAIWIGRPQEANEIQRRAVLIFDKLASDFPYVPNYRHQLAVTLHEHAGLLKHLGQAADAEKAYRRAIAVYEKLATDSPTMPAHWQSTFDLRLTLGQFLKEAGKVKEASGVYREADAIVSKLPTDVPGRLAHWVGLVRAHCELGRMLSYAGKKEEAEAAFRQAVTLSEKLEADFAGKPEHRRELAHSHAMAAWELAEARLHADADRLYGWALQHYLALVREVPQTKQNQEALARFHLSLGAHNLWRTRRLKDADRSFQAALEIFENLAQQFPDTLAYRVREAECRMRLGIVAQQEGRTQQAEQNLRQGIQLAEKVAKELPSDRELRLWLGSGSRWLATVLRDAGSPREVEKSLLQSLAVMDKLVAEFPNDGWYLFEQNGTWRSLALHHFRNGRTEEGRRLYQRVVESCEQMLADNAALTHNLTWLTYNASFLANRADGSPRAARLAVELAKRAVAIEPKGNHVNTLGIAFYRAGDWNSAIETLKKAEELTPEKHFGHNAIFIAMSYWRLGNKDEARRWYDRAVEWMDKNQPKDEDFRRFRAEAAELLGIEKKKD